MYEVSVIIPVYNVEGYVHDSLLSALDQSFESIEYIIVNDCSNDNSMAIVKEVIKNHSREKDVYIYNQERNSGLSSTRNLGIKYARGKYLFFMDSDDEISKDCIKLHYNTILSKGADFTVANVEQIGARSVHIHSVDKNVENMEPLVSYFRRQWSVSAWNKLYKREFVEEKNIRFINGIHHEDYLWSYEIAKNANSLALVEEKTYKYKIRPGSITTIVNGDIKIQSMLYVIDVINKDLSTHIDEKKRFIDFVGFNTALYILNYQGKHSRKFYYSKLQRITPPNQKVPILFLRN